MRTTSNREVSVQDGFAPTRARVSHICACIRPPQDEAAEGKEKRANASMTSALKAALPTWRTLVL